MDAARVARRPPGDDQIRRTHRAESIGGNIAKSEQSAVNQALQLDLPIIGGEPISVLYVQMDGTGVPVVKKEIEGRVGKVNGEPAAHTCEVKFGCVFTQTAWDKKACHTRSPARQSIQARLRDEKVSTRSGSLEVSGRKVGQMDCKTASVGFIVVVFSSFLVLS